MDWIVPSESNGQRVAVSDWISRAEQLDAGAITECNAIANG